MNNQRCIKCVLPSTTPNIRFDSNGICNYCAVYEPKQVMGEERFLKALQDYKLKNKSKKYD